AADSLSTPVIGVVQRSVLEGRAEGREQAIAHASQRACTAMAALPQGIIAVPSGRVVLDGNA
ncbi:hypothetical protein, partial [Bradyrhizobium sp. NBAIM01]|uniref:hypothetical protein n=1 Tax=Bradyrhizobium sp. NBAIM01 TaxID=2793818 RepID=UPI001CD7F0A8